jgi:citrate lyase beta subunit
VNRTRRSIIEVPTMDDHKWSKVPDIPADVVMVDMEDTVPPPLKTKARQRVLDLLDDPSYLGGREMLVRPNNLFTEWGREDMEALADAGISTLMNYPMVRSREEIEEVVSIFRERGASPQIWLAVETPEFVVDMEHIASCDGVTGIMFGLGDLALETGTARLNGRRAFLEGFLYARTKALMVARAHGLDIAESLFVENLKDLEALREEVKLSKLFGFDTNLSFYPAHIPIINEERTPTAAEVDWARRVVAAYDQGTANGKAAISLDERWITVHQYKEALAVIDLGKHFGVE